MTLKMRPTGLGSFFYKGQHRLQRFAKSGYIAASTKTAGPRFTALVLGALRSQQARDHAHLKQVATLEEGKAEFEAMEQEKPWAGGTDWLSNAEPRREGFGGGVPWTRGRVGLRQPEVHPHNAPGDPIVPQGEIPAVGRPGRSLVLATPASASLGSGRDGAVA
jgi:hypothetical protein